MFSIIRVALVTVSLHNNKTLRHYSCVAAVPGSGLTLIETNSFLKGNIFKNKLLCAENGILFYYLQFFTYIAGLITLLCGCEVHSANDIISLCF